MTNACFHHEIEIHDLFLIYKKESGKSNFDVISDAYYRETGRRLGHRGLIPELAELSIDDYISNVHERSMIRRYIENELGRIYLASARPDLKRFAVSALSADLCI